MEEQFNMEEQLNLTSDTNDSDDSGDESDDSSVSSRYSSEGDIPLPTYDDFSDSDDSVTGLKTSGCMLSSNFVSTTEQRNIVRTLSDESRQAFFGIFPASIEDILTKEYAHMVKRLRELPDRECSVIIAGGSLRKMIDPSWEGRVPASLLCDVCVFSPTRPVLVLTFTSRDEVNQKTIQYNTQLASLIIQHVKKDTKFDFNVVHGTVDNISCQEKHGLLTKLAQRQKLAESIYFPNELHMDKDKCTSVIKSLLKYLSDDTETERLPPTAEDEEHVTTISKQDAIDEPLHTVEEDDEPTISKVNQHDKVDVLQLKYRYRCLKDREELFQQRPLARQSKASGSNGWTGASSKMDIFPKCSVCQQQFILEGPAPYLLPCLHAVCKTCVTSEAGGVISCSTCERKVNLSDTSLQEDAVRQKEVFHLTVKHRSSDLPCTHEDDGNQAMCCQECEEFLCEYCQNMHSSFKLIKNHVLQNVTDMEPTISNVPTFCGFHKHDSLYLFDKSCRKLICARCRIEVHADHEVEKIDVVADTVTKQLDHHKNELSKLQAHQHSHMQSLRQVSEFTDRTHNTLEETIGDTFQTLRALLDQREKELLIDLESHTKENKATLHARLNTCEDDRKTCTWVLDYIRKVLLYASSLDILDLGSCVGNMTQICLDTVMPQTHDVPTAVFNTSSLSKLKSHISEFATILTCDMDGESVKDKETQTYDYIADLEMKHKMDITELKTKIDADEKHIESLKLLTDQLNAEIKSLKSHIDEKEKVEKRAPQIMDFLRELASEYSVHLLNPGAVDTSMLLKCIHLKYDKDRVNLDKVHINTEGYLVNRKSDTRPAGEGRLKKYWGTCSTAPLPRAGCPQYWEVMNRVSLDKSLTERDLILEVGVCREEQRDVRHCINARSSSYCMLVVQCPTHDGICRETWKEGKSVLCLPDTLPNTAGASHTLHYGVVYDDARKMIVFIDMKENKVMSTFDNVDSSQPLWPMFGVYNPSRLTVSMTLVVGSDINMTEEKKAMIAKALS